MSEQNLGARMENNSSVRSLGIIISSISLIQFAVSLILFWQENHSFIFVLTQNGALIASSLVLTTFSYKFDSTLQSVGIEKRKLFIRFSVVSLIVGFIAIILYIVVVPYPQPKFDEEGVGFFYAMLIVINGISILNLVFNYLGVKNFREWLEADHEVSVSRKEYLGFFFSLAALITYLVANIPFLDAALKFESYANPIDPSIFIIHFMIAIALLYIALGLLLVGMILKALSGFELIRKYK